MCVCVCVCVCVGGGGREREEEKEEEGIGSFDIIQSDNNLKFIKGISFVCANYQHFLNC